MAVSEESIFGSGSWLWWPDIGLRCLEVLWTRWRLAWVSWSSRIDQVQGFE